MFILNKQVRFSFIKTTDALVIAIAILILLQLQIKKIRYIIANPKSTKDEYSNNAGLL